ncbi:MAG TPA: dienelactone hydrolase family protein [Bacteroidales bacterium]|jgi:carboxymethylenebutenolidase|nr:dienelactone hydrolase family protein [Bacteroidales bacterium]MDI9532150.1 dienelactone hydrolase family protein [Bacteroidota bacterium]OPZ57394.1 MAG: Carboxymethylenebutenolidase [Bacteroidetes bacterium ADurb.BinA012]MBK7731320.1 dienelactone hydrolase family protein [Bacteroidales bacterium]MBP7036460.1 dienelactone hydrolase family protein [Bacteroidales bacterium]
MKRKVDELYDEYRNGNVSRREFMKKLALVTGGTAAAVVILPGCNGATTRAAAKNAMKVVSEFITYPGASGDMRAWISIPEGKEKYPGVLVIHENRGLVPHIREVNDRMAMEGFVALAPDALSPLGGTPDDQNKSREMMGQLDREETIRNFVAAVKYLKTHPRTTGKVGCTGFCWGGAMTNQVAVNSPDLDAAVPYYGSTPEPEDVPKIRAKVMAHYADNDERINAGIPAFEEALKKAGIEYHIFIYEGTQHAFNNDTGERYNKEAADLAWKRTTDFFKEKLKS